MKFEKLKKFFAVTVLFGVVAITLGACSQKPQKSSNKISIMTTTNVYADIAQNVVGRYGKAEALIKNPSADPHDFEPTTNDAKALSSADIVIENGLGYDSWMDKLASSVEKEPVKVGEDLMGRKKGDNPHIWFDLNMPKEYVNYLIKRLSKKDPKHADYYRENGLKYLAKIDRIKKDAAKIDHQVDKPVYVSEPVFDYALSSVNIKVANQDFEKAIQNNTDPSAATVQEMTHGIEKRKIAFFVDNEQTSSTTVNNFIKLAKKNKIPVLKVRETIPTKMTYLDWMTESYQKLADVAKK